MGKRTSAATCTVKVAAAHASLYSTTVNPDNPADSVRLHQDLPIVEALAFRVIEDRLGVKSRNTALREQFGGRATV